MIYDILMDLGSSWSLVFLNTQQGQDQLVKLRIFQLSLSLLEQAALVLLLLFLPFTESQLSSGNISVIYYLHAIELI